MAFKFVPNPLGIALIARTPLMARAMLDRAGEVAETAASIAPVGPGHGGHYKDEIDTAPIVSGGVAGARVNAHKFTSAWVEFGNSKVSAHAPLRTACDAVGLTLSEGGGE